MYTVPGSPSAAALGPTWRLTPPRPSTSRVAKPSTRAILPVATSTTSTDAVLPAGRGVPGRNQAGVGPRVVGKVVKGEAAGAPARRPGRVATIGPAGAAGATGAAAAPAGAGASFWGPPQATPTRLIVPKSRRSC